MDTIVAAVNGEPLADSITSVYACGESLILLSPDQVRNPLMSNIKIMVRDNGPLLVSGSISVEDAEGNVFDTAGKETVALCRCGESKNRPFCDGAHKACNFEAAERAVR